MGGGGGGRGWVVGVVGGGGWWGWWVEVGEGESIQDRLSLRPLVDINDFVLGRQNLESQCTDRI